MTNHTQPSPQVPTLVAKLREHDDQRLYEEADVLMCAAADEIERLLAQSAQASNAEQVGFGVFWKEQGMECSTLKSTEADALSFVIKLGVPGASVEPVYRAAKETQHG